MAGSGLNSIEMLEKRSAAVAFGSLLAGIALYKIIFPSPPDHIILVHDDVDTLVAAKSIITNDLEKKNPGKRITLEFPTICEMHSIKQLPFPKGMKNNWEVRKFEINGFCRVWAPKAGMYGGTHQAWKMTMTFTHPFPGKANNLKRYAYFKQLKDEYNEENPDTISGMDHEFVRDALSPRSCWTHSPIEYSDYVEPQPKVPKAPGPRKSWKDTKVEVPAA